MDIVSTVGFPRDLVNWRRDAAQYVERGNKCELWGYKVPDMSRDDLVAFIGFLDEHVTLRFSGATEIAEKTPA